MSPPRHSRTSTAWARAPFAITWICVGRRMTMSIGALRGVIACERLVELGGRTCLQPHELPDQEVACALGFCQSSLGVQQRMRMDEQCNAAGIRLQCG